MSEPINVQNAPKIYQSYLKQAATSGDDDSKANINEEGQAKKAAVAFCSEKPEPDCQKFLQFLDDYGYKFDRKDIISNASSIPVATAETPSSVEPDYLKWRFVLGLFGFAPHFKDTSKYMGDTGVEKANNYYNILTPGVGVSYRASRKLFLETNLRAIFTAPYHAYALDTDAQFKYTIWHKEDDGYDVFRVNLGFGLATDINLYKEDGALVGPPPPSAQTRSLLGWKTTLELEGYEFGSVSLEFMRLTNMDGHSIMGGSIYFKFYFPENPIIHNSERDNRIGPGHYDFNPFYYNK